MTWMITNTGRDHYLSGIAQHLNAAPTIEEIAHSLAQINRFTGHCRRPYSVAEHSLLVASIAAHEGASLSAQLGALMHDAHEAFTGDVSSPVKWTIGERWEVFEHSQATALHTALGIRTTMLAHRADIKRWDLIALATERRDLTRFDPKVNQPWGILDTPGQEVHPLHLNLRSEARHNTGWLEWMQIFIEKHDQLQSLTRQRAP
jgi:hypothetical protein